VPKLLGDARLPGGSGSRLRWTKIVAHGRKKSFLPKLTSRAALLSQKVETAGIEPREMFPWRAGRTVAANRRSRDLFPIRWESGDELRVEADGASQYAQCEGRQVAKEESFLLAPWR
jgi:hypothetical protein